MIILIFIENSKHDHNEEMFKKICFTNIKRCSGGGRYVSSSFRKCWLAHEDPF